MQEFFLQNSNKNSRFYDDFKYFLQFFKIKFFVDKNVHTASNLTVKIEAVPIKVTGIAQLVYLDGTVLLSLYTLMVQYCSACIPW